MLYHKKIERQVRFDILIYSFDSAMVSELFGIYILNEVSKLVDKNENGLYRDDIEILIMKSSKIKIELLTKWLHKLSKNMGFCIEPEPEKSGITLCWVEPRNQINEAIQEVKQPPIKRKIGEN